MYWPKWSWNFLHSHGSIHAPWFRKRSYDDPMVEKSIISDWKANQKVTTDSYYQYLEQYLRFTRSTKIIIDQRNINPIRRNKLPREKLHMEKKKCSLKYEPNFIVKWYCWPNCSLWGIISSWGGKICACYSYSFQWWSY